MAKQNNRLNLNRLATMAALPLLVGLSGMAYADDHEVSAAEFAEIAARLKPVGSVKTTASASAPAVAASAPAEPAAAPAEVVATATEAPAVDGASVYQTACFACHGTGAAGAPRLANADEWGPRLEKGIDALYSNALNGFNAMPAKGGNMSLSDEEVNAAVDHLVASVR